MIHRAFPIVWIDSVSLKTVAASLLATLILMVLLTVSISAALWLGNKRLVAVEQSLNGGLKDFENRKSLTQQAEETATAISQIQTSAAVVERQTAEYLDMSRRTLEVVEGVAGIQRDRGKRIKKAEDETKARNKAVDKEIFLLKDRLVKVESFVRGQIQQEAKKGGKRSLMRLGK